MKTKIKKIFIGGIYTSLFILMCGFSLSKYSDSKLNIISEYYSDYQLDKTYGGSRVEDRKQVYITLSDPKNLTKEGMRFEDLPKGYVTIQYEGLNPVKNEILYIGKNRSNAEIYTVINHQLNYDLLYVIKELHKVGNKNYLYTILLGTGDENNLGGLPRYFTAYHCNTFKKIK